MSLSTRRIRAIVWKELREYRRNRSVVASMAIFPLIFIVQPLIAILGLSSSSSGTLAHEHVLLYLLGIPALVPVFIAAYAVAGERQQGTLEPVLTTPIRREEFLLGKALAALIPSLVVSYGVYALFLACVAILARPGVAPALLSGPDILAQLFFTPLLAAWSIWVGIGVSARASDVRVAQQLSVLVSLPPVFLIAAIALNAIQATLGLALGLGALLAIADGLGWRIMAGTFDRERLVTGTHS